MHWIAKYWVEVVFGFIVAALTAGFRVLWKRLRGREKEEKAIKEGLLAILHDRLYQECTRFIAQGYIDVASLKNIEYIYNAYHALGGNGTGTELYHRVCALEIKED